MPEQPWEKYAQQSTQGGNPWDKYGAPPMADTGGLQQTFDENTRANPSDSLLQTGLKGATRAVGAPFVHPLKTIQGLSHMGPHDPENPISGQVQGAVEDYKQGGLPYALADQAGQMAGGALLGKLGGDVAGGIAKIPEISANLGERFGGYKSPVIDPALQNASKLATAIRPPQGIPFGLEKDLATQFPLTKAFAQQTGNPLHSQWEAAQAARGLGEKGLSHFNENILGPNAEAQIPVTGVKPFQGFTGPNITQGRMSLGQINSRLGEINDLMRPASGAKTEGASMTALERQGLEQEAGMLRNKLYTELGQRTGLEPDAIKGMREGYGKQFNIADTIDSARRARLGGIGAAAEGGSVPLSKMGVLDKAVTALRGGQEYLANRNFRKAASPFAPVEPEFPQPQYPQKLQGDEFNNPFLNRRK